MKFLICKVNTKKKARRKKLKVSLERLLFFLFISTFFLLIIIQAGLMTPSIRTFLTTSDEFDGTPLGIEEFLYGQGELGLQLISEESNENLKVLVNGEEVATFSTKDLTIDVKNGDVVEIDGCDIQENIEVKIVYKSENIINDCIDAKINIESGIKQLMKVELE